MIFCRVFHCAAVQQPQISIRWILWRKRGRKREIVRKNQIPKENIPSTVIFQTQPKQQILKHYSNNYKLRYTFPQDTSLIRTACVKHSQTCRNTTEKLLHTHNEIWRTPGKREALSPQIWGNRGLQAERRTHVGMCPIIPTALEPVIHSGGYLLGVATSSKNKCQVAVNPLCTNLKKQY